MQISISRSERNPATDLCKVFSTPDTEKGEPDLLPSAVAPVRIFFIGSKAALQQRFFRPGIDPESEGHFDICKNISEYDRAASLYLRQIGDGARILFEIGSFSAKSERDIRAKLSTLPSLFDALPYASFFIRSDRAIRIPEVLRHRLKPVAAPDCEPETSTNPMLLKMKIPPLLYPDWLEGTIAAGYRYSGALVSAMRSVDRIRRRDGK